MRALPRQHDDLCLIVLLERSKDRPQFLAHLQVKANALLRARLGYSANLVFVLAFHGLERHFALAHSAYSAQCITTSADLPSGGPRRPAIVHLVIRPADTKHSKIEK